MAKRFGNIFAIFICAVIILSGCMPVKRALAAFELTESDRDYIASIKDTPIRFAYSYDALVMESPDGGVDGTMTPITDFLQNELGLKTEFRKMGWSDAYDALDSGDIDAYGFVVLSESRREKYVTTSSLFKADAQIISRTSEPIGSLVNLEGKKIGLFRGTVMGRTLETYLLPTGSAIYYPSLDDMLDALEKGEVDCIATFGDTMLEILRRPTIDYEFSVENFYSDRGLIGSNERFRQLFDIISRYVESQDDFEEKMASERERIILNAERERLSDEIEFLRHRYEKITAFDSGVSYPMFYKEKNVYKGLQVEINSVFENLTGIKIEYQSIDNFPDGVYSAIETLKTGECVILGGSYFNIDIDKDPMFTYSLPFWTDTLRAYTISDVNPDFHKMRVGSAPLIADYVDWDTVCGRMPIVMNSKKVMLDALKKREIDIAFLSEMSFDYMNIIQKDFSLKQVGDISAKVDIQMIYNTQNTEFNRLYDEAIKLYKALYPRRTLEWKKTSETYKSNYIRDRELRLNMISLVVVVFIMMSLALTYVLWRYKTYDRQISQLICDQQTFDLVWGNIRKNTYSSKGNHAFFRKRGLNVPEPNCSLDDMSDVVEWDLSKDYLEAMRMMKAEESSISVSDKKIISPVDGSKIYYRRYLHLLNDNEFMACLQDITDEVEREDELKHIATTDFLSNLLTRRAMNDMIIKKCEDIRVNGGKAYLVMFDIDDFKYINDSFGHDVGDKVLVAIADVIQSTPGCEDVTSRWGGEEFLVLMECDDVKIAEELTNRIIVNVSKREVEFSGKTLTVTISAGISQLDPRFDYTRSLNLADQAMYKAKRSGKNCLSIL